jgi:hypothetical protein
MASEGDWDRALFDEPHRMNDPAPMGAEAPSKYRVVVATPVDAADLWSGKVSLGYSEHLRMLSHEMPILQVVGFAQDVVRSRNRLVATVLQNFPTMTHVLWWDEDTWPEDRKIVREMLEMGHDFIAAAYTNKREPVRWVYQPFPAPPKTDGLTLEVRAVGFGFTLTSRACLERMFREHRKYRDWPNELRCADMFGQLFDSPNPDSEVYCPEADEMLLSEDYSFCKRWRALGGKVLINLNAGVICHAGTKAWSVRDMVTA